MTSGNMTDLEVKLVYPVGYNTNPHIDEYERGVEAAEVVSIIPNVTPKFTPGGICAEFDFLFIVEKTG
jgi:hypothetical protein